MKLKFKAKRLALIKSLRHLTYRDIVDGMNKYNKSKRRLEHPVDRWADGSINPKDDQLPALASACGVPVCFFYYNELRITVAPCEPYDMQIFICETHDVINIPLLK